MNKPHLAAAGPSRLWRGVLVVSLALNLAVMGLIGGALVSGRFADAPPHRIDFGLGPVSRALARDDRRAIGRALRADSQLRGQDLRDQMTAVAVALRAEPFDASVLQSLLDDQAMRLSTIQTRARVAVVDRVRAMSPAERLAFADRFEDELHRNRGPRDAASRD